MSKKDTKILKNNHCEKSKEVAFIIYADLVSLPKKMSTFHNNSDNSSTAEINKNADSGNSLLTNCSFDAAKNKLDRYRGKDCMKKLSKDLREYTTKIINYEKRNDNINK